MTTRSRLALVGVLTIVGASAAGRVVSAGRWNVQVASCPVDHDSDYNERYLVTAGGVKHFGTATGTIDIVCSINDDLTGIDALGFTYTDSDGTGTSQQVLVTLKRTEKTTGSITNLGNINSNSFSQTGLTYHTAAVSHTMDVVNYYYYLQIGLTRGSGTATGSIRGVEIQF